MASVMNARPILPVIAALSPWLAPAHPCPYDWNIEFSKPTTIEGKNLVKFVEKFNEAARKETNGKIDTAIVLDPDPKPIKKIPGDSPYAKQMDGLIRRYREAIAPLIKKGVSDYGTAPIRIDFPAHFPVACLLLAQFDGPNYKETQQGAILSLPRAHLQCRAYKLGDAFFSRVEELRDSEIVPEGTDPAAYFFASWNGMQCSFLIHDAPENPHEVSILEAVTIFLPTERVMLAIETPERHKKMAKTLAKRGYLQGTKPPPPDANTPDPSELDPFAP